MKSIFWGIMKLKPSEIFFSQDSISNKWGKQSSCRSKLIGETLDELLTEHIAVKDIPIITVVIKDRNFYTADNRRLWIFRKAEELGFVYAIEVDHVTRRHVKRKKFTSKNGGISIKIRGSGDPGGQIWRTWKPNSNQDINETTEELALRSHVIYESKTNVIQNSFFSNIVNGAQYPSTYNLSYNNYNSATPDVWCDNSFSVNRETPDPLLTTKILLPSIKTTKVDEKATQDTTSSFDSIYMESLLRVEGPTVYQGSTNVTQNFYSPNIHIHTLPSSSDSPVSAAVIAHSSIKRPTANFKVDPTRRVTSSVESRNRSTSLRVHGAFINQNKPNFNRNPSFNNTFTKAQLRSTFKYSYNDCISARPDVLCDNEFWGICEASSSSFCNFLLWLREHALLDFFIGLLLYRRSSIKRTSFEEEPSMRNTSSFESSKGNALLRAQGPIIKQDWTSVKRHPFCYEPVTEAQHLSKYKQVNSKNNSDKPDFLCGKDFWSNSESIIRNTEHLHSSMKRSIHEEEPSLRGKPSSEASNRNTLLRVQGRFIKKQMTKVNQCSVCNNTCTVSQHTSTNKLSYSDDISANTDVRCDTDFLGLCESSSASFCNFILWLGAQQFLDFFSGLKLV